MYCVQHNPNLEIKKSPSRQLFSYLKEREYHEIFEPFFGQKKNNKSKTINLTTFQKLHVSKVIVHTPANKLNSEGLSLTHIEQLGEIR